MQGGFKIRSSTGLLLKMVSETKKRFPDVTRTTGRVRDRRMTEVSEMSYEQVFEALWETGRDRCPGGGRKFF
ncbi:MAG: hypothetical protein Ct9H300mP19_06660 [Dehalococcoidia bacterium]|nr:MAG: hypothetical protein Ct9H300mP19_06660 [Dehalococcoidia bacterium]